jgi:hypothetical protein
LICEFTQPLASLAGAAAVLNHPFGSHPLPYAAGSITPNHVGQPAQDQAVRGFYDAWKAAIRFSLISTPRRA